MVVVDMGIKLGTPWSCSMCAADDYVFGRSIAFTVGIGIIGDALHMVSTLCVALVEAVHHLVMVHGHERRTMPQCPMGRDCTAISCTSL